MKLSEKKIREGLRQFPVPAYDPEGLEKTVRSAERAYGEQLIAKRIGFPEFIAMQVRFIGRWVWAAHSALLLLFLLLLSRYQFGIRDMQPVFLLFSTIAPLVAFVGFPEILKSCSHNMEEIEACTRFSLRRLMAARMLILGLADLCCLTAILAASSANKGALVWRMILYLFVPFNLTCCGCLTVLRRVRNRYDGYSCAAVCAFCVAVFTKLSFRREYYEAAASGVWAVLFFLSAAYIVFEVFRALQSPGGFFRTKEETVFIPW